MGEGGGARGGVLGGWGWWGEAGGGLVAPPPPNPGSAPVRVYSDRSYCMLSLYASVEFVKIKFFLKKDFFGCLCSCF